ALQSMKMNRRIFLTTSGAILVAVVGGSVYRAVNQGVFASGQGIAYEPWKNWRDGTTGPERIVRAGILAANPHNSQPWHFRIGEQTVDLYADYSRQIGVIDPLRREMHIGLGCAVENMILATQAEGFDIEVGLLPDSKYLDPVPLWPWPPAKAQGSNLSPAIPSRHTNRGPYDLSKSVGSNVLDSLATLSDHDTVRIFWFAESAKRDQFGKVAIAAAE